MFLLFFPSMVIASDRPHQDTLVAVKGQALVFAQGHEDMYGRLADCKLIYTDPDTKVQKVLSIPAGAHPLNYTFDLSGCGKAGQFISIATGYKKGKIATNIRNPYTKVELWLTPRFLFKSMPNFQLFGNLWEEAYPLGLFWTWGEDDRDGDNCDFVTDKSLNEIMSTNLLDNWYGATFGDRRVPCEGLLRNFIFQC
jgi:hypothetical protein